ncbi:hypothetical protein GCM10011400_29730 [Paraburkholderia caffeinilytica]|uniref:Uncharacterized protein n=1 Tax=Paraburkholderia caffeinilytica TaxID=1761016 RepID=A0ABQ1MI90_9BURK|nr:hypothetical protein GCM10011400_29730 [Paraburkholderia caffeinilytica]CAB3787607.1 hypothetical protein LMG28690_02479 [Paraburkholderia caffeinilytica]
MNLTYNLTNVSVYHPNPDRTYGTSSGRCTVEAIAVDGDPERNLVAIHATCRAIQVGGSWVGPQKSERVGPRWVPQYTVTGTLPDGKIISFTDLRCTWQGDDKNWTAHSSRTCTFIR